MTNNLRMTRHAQMRLQQRGFRQDDLAVVLQAATQVAPDAYMLTRKDAEREIVRRKQEIHQLERLCGSKFVVEGGEVVTCYHTQKAEQKRTLRRRRK